MTSAASFAISFRQRPDIERFRDAPALVAAARLRPGRPASRKPVPPYLSHTRVCRWVPGHSRGVNDLLGYARISTADQDPALQHDALTAAGCYRVWTDTASGAKTQRPQLDAVLDALRPGDSLVVWRIDRLGRSLPHLIETVTALGERGVHFRSLTEGFDTTTAGGEFLFHILGALAQMERRMIVERMAMSTRIGPGWAVRSGPARGRLELPCLLSEAGCMRVELLTSPGCPNAAAARRLLGDCLSEVGVPENVVVERVGGYPSPTVLVDGVDVMKPGTELMADACRLDLPTRDRVISALQDARPLA